MTNFEHWKQELKIKDLIHYKILGSESICLSCVICPAYAYCSNHDEECVIAFKKWARKKYTNKSEAVVYDLQKNKVKITEI